MVSRWRIQRVLRYVREHPGCTEDEIAQALRMHILDVLEALHILEAEGLVRGEEIPPISQVDGSQAKS
ncbi:MAG: hypothetical protein DRN49_06430 [Thaumarchaeota archaeon]|nr:MAG: hypothetical protein DRN49_06430 [Nitrososphaerota archaeon]